MKHTIFAAVLMLVGLTANATGTSYGHHNIFGDTYTGPVDESTTNSASGVGIGGDSYSSSGSYSEGGSAASGSYSEGGSSVSGASSAGQSNSMSVNSYGRRQAPTVIAPALTSGNDTCMGSSSVGGSGPGFGFSVGSTWSDEHCKMLKSASVLYALGLRDAAIARICMDEMNRKAIEATGVKCPVIENVSVQKATSPFSGLEP